MINQPHCSSQQQKDLNSTAILPAHHAEAQKH
jgi:hypothetical protein